MVHTDLALPGDHRTSGSGANASTRQTGWDVIDMAEIPVRSFCNQKSFLVGAFEMLAEPQSACHSDFPHDHLGRRSGIR